MALESVATAGQGNVISEAEMQHALDSSAPVDPGKFIPYRKLIAQLGGARDMLDRSVAELLRLRALMVAVRTSAANGEEELIPDLSMIGQDMAQRLIETFDHESDALDRVIESAKATSPRKRWEDSGAPDDRADAEDIAREAAASVCGTDLEPKDAAAAPRA